jgi:transposase-like protein
MQIYNKKTKKARKKKKKTKRYVKNGFCAKTGKQKWYDKKENRHFFKEYAKRGYDEETKKKAVEFAKEGIGCRKTGRLLHVSHVSVYRWVRAYCEKLYKQALPEKSNGIELDELWSFCQKKR